ncbi:MAG TPA: VWA domain-containing protein [Pyrinomonadaceae bacterium]|nr:VWA domain-containing protein [Pyrinomonadaceae bacterium]
MRVFIAGLLIAVIVGSIDLASAQQPSSQTPADDVLRVNTELVQTALTVVDKKGKFVEGLGRGDFELVVDGKPRPISFLERVTAGSAKEVELRKPADASTPAPVPGGSTFRGRTIVFFIDDLHLSLSSLNRTRQMIAHFLETEMSSRDSVAIASSKGQIGFLQQFTSNKEVLQAALARVMPQPSEERTIGIGSVPMSEFTAHAIDTKPDSRTNSVFAVYIEECLKQGGFLGGDRRTALAVRLNCEKLVKSNARNVLLQTGYATERTYQTLETLMRSSARFPGRKLVFFVSDGFLAQGGPMSTSLSNKLKQITDAAQSANTVIYSIDARGLISGTLDATNNLVPDANGRMAGVAAAEIFATQEALNALAEDTGGRALRNQNYFDVWVDKVLDETSNYYVIAWRPSTEAEKESKFRNIKISVVGRSDLTVRAPRGYIEQPQVAEVARQPAGEEPKNKTSELHNVLSDFYPSGSLPTALSLTHLNTPANGPLLTSSFQIAGGSLNYGEGGKQPATVKLAGVILNDKGKIAGSFQTQLNVKPPSSGETDSSAIIYNHREPLTPGIYQVRAAALDERSRRIGSAMQWIVIPDLSTRQLTLSSVLIGGQNNAKNNDANFQLSADHRFSRSDHLRYWIFIYNAKRDASGATNLTVETQVLRDGKVIQTTNQKLNDKSPDPDRIPYVADLSLQSLTSGSYDLRIKITDAIAGKSATQTTDFVVQ